MVISWDDMDSANDDKPRPPIRAAQYVRMSTEHQQYSTDNQAAAIARYAEQRGYEIVKTYADEGKSGLNISGRVALQLLLEEIESGVADFDAVLVYDVSRWGRFQDPDEAASYELRCKRAGIQVQYCADDFDNDGSIGSSIIKTVKRTMAGAYSRDLSIKVFAGQANLIRRGYRQGGMAGFGLRRVLVDQDGNRKGELKRGEHKSIQTDRVVLVPGPEAEQEIVREVYSLFVDGGQSEREIAELLNHRAIMTDLDRPWTQGTIHQLLINEKYIGNNVWARTSFKLKQKHVTNDPDRWIRHDGAFPAIVERECFDRAQSIIFERSARLTDDEMLGKLRTILEMHQTLSGLIIDEFEGAPSSSSFRTRFGSLLRAYALVGFKPKQDYQYIETNRQLREMHPQVLQEILIGLRNAGAFVRIDPQTDLLHINEEFTAALIIARCFTTPAGTLRWKLRLDAPCRPHLTIGVRMATGNQEILDYYLVPRLSMEAALVRLCEHNGLSLDGFRFPTPEYLFQMAARSPFRRAG
jgi:DNA invertase Pin-like site-specific DNA recombinase